MGSVAGRNIVEGPGYINLDSSLFKEFPIKETMRLQLRFEAFNTFNTPHFANPDGVFSDGTFGQIQREDRKRSKPANSDCRQIYFLNPPLEPLHGLCREAHIAAELFLLRFSQDSTLFADAHA